MTQGKMQTMAQEAHGVSPARTAAGRLAAAVRRLAVPAAAFAIAAMLAATAGVSFAGSKAKADAKSGKCPDGMDTSEFPTAPLAGLAVSNYGGGAGSVETFAPCSHGNAKPATEIKGNKTGMIAPSVAVVGGIGVGSLSNSPMVETNTEVNAGLATQLFFSIGLFSPGSSNGNTPPAATISSPMPNSSSNSECLSGPTSSPNAACTAFAEPYPCCTGDGMGTCGNSGCTAKGLPNSCCIGKNAGTCGIPYPCCTGPEAGSCPAGLADGDQAGLFAPEDIAFANPYNTDDPLVADGIAQGNGNTGEYFAVSNYGFFVSPTETVHTPLPSVECTGPGTGINQITMEPSAFPCCTGAGTGDCERTDTTCSGANATGINGLLCPITCDPATPPTNAECTGVGNAGCTGNEEPVACCTGLGVGSCAAPYTCCTGPGTGTCNSISAGLGAAASVGSINEYYTNESDASGNNSPINAGEIFEQNAACTSCPVPGLQPPTITKLATIAGCNTVLLGPSGLAFNGNNNLFVTDAAGETKGIAAVLVFAPDAAGDVIPVGAVGANLPPLLAGPLVGPQFLAVTADSSNLFVTDVGNPALTSKCLDINTKCTAGPDSTPPTDPAPFACCTGAGTGTCDNINGDCTGLGAPYACCSGAGTGTCDGPNSECTGFEAPNSCCSGPGQGFCNGTPYACCTGTGTGTCGQVGIKIFDITNSVCTGYQTPYSCCVGGPTNPNNFCDPTTALTNASPLIGTIAGKKTKLKRPVGIAWNNYDNDDLYVVDHLTNSLLVWDDFDCSGNPAPTCDLPPSIVIRGGRTHLNFPVGVAMPGFTPTPAPSGSTE